MDGPDKEGLSRQTERYKRILWYVAAGLCAFLAVASFAVSVRCYIPYSFMGYMTPALRVALFSTLSPGAAVSALALVAANKLISKLSSAALICVCVLMAVITGAPLLLLFTGWRNAVFVVNAAIFFDLPLTLYIVFRSFSCRVKSRRAICSALLFAVAMILLANSAVILYIFFRGRLLTASAASLTLPVVSLAGIILGAARLFFDKANNKCDVAFFVLLAIDCLSICLMVAVEAFVPIIGFASFAVAVWLAADAVLFIKRSNKTEREQLI